MMRSFSSPTGGWNARDALDSMNPEDAVFLDNIVPDAGKCVLRKGYTLHADTLGGHVETLSSYESGSTRKLLACANNNIWDVTGSGNGSSLASGFTNDRWQTFQMKGKLAFVNGDDTPQQYDGSTVTTLTVTGPTASNLIWGHTFKSRSYFGEDGSASFWYSAVNALGGTVTEFDLSNYSSGQIMFMSTWSRDAGDGMDDFAVFVMSTGNVIIYQGSNPGDATDWSLVGVYKTGDPLSRRSYVKVGGDLVLITREGFMPLSAVIQKGQFAKGSIINDKIRNVVETSGNSYGSNFGWEAVHFPPGNKIFFNIPISENIKTHQYVYVTSIGAWCRYKQITANCWAVCDNNIYFGGNTKVFQAENGFNDDGSEIEGDALPAFNYMGKRSANKIYNSVMHSLSSSGSLEFKTKLDTNFRIPSLSTSTITLTTAGTKWNTSKWNTVKWSGGEQIISRWIVVAGYGYNASARINIKSSNKSVSWYSVNYLYDIGGTI